MEEWGYRQRSNDRLKKSGVRSSLEKKKNRNIHANFRCSRSEKRNKSIRLCKKKERVAWTAFSAELEKRTQTIEKHNDKKALGPEGGNFNHRKLLQFNCES
jgi:hypothetical protein